MTEQLEVPRSQTVDAGGLSSGSWVDITPEIGLALVSGHEAQARYLQRGLRSSLQRIDAQFNATSGHTHGGEHQGGPIVAQRLIASYVQQVGSWSLPTANVWTETPIQVTVQFSGVLCRVEFAFAVICPVKGQHIAWGIMVDGADPPYVLGAIDAPEQNYGSMAVGTYYLTPPPTSHVFAVGLYGPSGATLGQTIWSTLYITEQVC